MFSWHINTTITHKILPQHKLYALLALGWIAGSDQVAAPLNIYWTFLLAWWMFKQSPIVQFSGSFFTLLFVLWTMSSQTSNATILHELACESLQLQTIAALVAGGAMCHADAGWYDGHDCHCGHWYCSTWASSAGCVTWVVGTVMVYLHIVSDHQVEVNVSTNSTVIPTQKLPLSLHLSKGIS